MKTINFKITSEQLDNLNLNNPNFGKNADVGKLAVEVAKLYFLERNRNTHFIENKDGVDLTTINNNIEEEFEIKGTVDPNIAFSKLKVSSQRVHDKLVNGLTLLRVCNIGKKNIIIHFMKHNEDFTMHPEPRWCVKKV